MHLPEKRAALAAVGRQDSWKSAETGNFVSIRTSGTEAGVPIAMLANFCKQS